MPNTKTEMDGDVYYPSDEVVAQANVPDWDEVAEYAREDLEGFWADRAEELEWFEKWDKVLDNSNKPFFKWFVGGKDQYRSQLHRPPPKDQAQEQAGLDLGERGRQGGAHFLLLLPQPRSQPHGQHHQGHGGNKGDRVTIYMPRIPEIVFAMLACAKIGAIHSVVFGGFSADALKGRIDDSNSKLVITGDGSYRTASCSSLSASWTRPSGPARPSRT